jgi:hypothetical protein
MRISSIFIICVFVALPSTLFSATSTTAASTTIYPSEEVLQKLNSLKTKEVQKYKAKKQDPSDKKAQTGITLGWIAVGATALIVVAAIIVASSDAWY